VAAIEEANAFSDLLEQILTEFEFIVVDTPDPIRNCRAPRTPQPTRSSRRSTTVFVDFDLLASVDPVNFSVDKPSVYSDFVWECRKKRLLARRPALDWVVMRNRIGATEARNKRRVSAALDALARRIGFRVSPGFGERVIYRELFPMGLTMLDLPQPQLGISLTMSHVAAGRKCERLLRC